jgi:hemoglobin
VDKNEQFEALGGRKILEVVAKEFYDRLYEHPWLSKFFEEIPQERIEKQQVDFMQAALGGPNVYCGSLPIPAHQHIYIDEEMFDLRQVILIEALKKCGSSTELIDKWLKIDSSFKSRIVKSSIAECEKRFFTDNILAFPNPKDQRKAA